MEIISFTRVLLVAFTTVFPVVNPIGCAAIFLSMTRHYPQTAQRVLSRKIAFYGFAILAVSLLLAPQSLISSGLVSW
jgi:small neutral amino acid transporter SnatA (MarC family)